MTWKVVHTNTSGYRVVFHENRRQPYTVWHSDSVLYFAEDLEEAMFLVQQHGRKIS